MPLKERTAVWSIFFDSSVTADKYPHLLGHFFLPQLNWHQKVSYGLPARTALPPHWGLQVRSFLDKKFQNRRIGRDRPLLWAVCSPDLTQRTVSFDVSSRPMQTWPTTQSKNFVKNVWRSKDTSSLPLIISVKSRKYPNNRWRMPRCSMLYLHVYL